MVTEFEDCGPMMLTARSLRGIGHIYSLLFTIIVSGMISKTFNYASFWWCLYNSWGFLSFIAEIFLCLFDYPQTGVTYNIYQLSITFMIYTWPLYSLLLFYKHINKNRQKFLTFFKIITSVIFIAVFILSEYALIAYIQLHDYPQKEKKFQNALRMPALFMGLLSTLGIIIEIKVDKTVNLDWCSFLKLFIFGFISFYVLIMKFFFKKEIIGRTFELQFSLFYSVFVYNIDRIPELNIFTKKFVASYNTISWADADDTNESDIKCNDNEMYSISNNN